MLKVVDGRVPALSLKSYFTQHDKLRIPSWQRDYSWDASDEGQVGILIEDFQGFVNDAAADEYLMGSVILCDSNVLGENLVIDGQQRSLTISIFLMAALKYIRNNNLIDPLNPIQTQLINDLHTCTNTGQIGFNFSSRVIMNNPAADAVIKLIYQWSQLADDVGDDILRSGKLQTKSERNLIEVGQYIYRRMCEGDVFKLDQFVDGLAKIISKVKLIVLTLDNQSEALRIYDRINNRGMVLSSADLIKNIIFMNVNDNEFDQVSDCWLDMARELNGTGKARLQDPKFLLRMLAGIDTGSKITYDGLVKYWSDLIEEGAVNPIDFANELPAKAASLKSLASNQQMLPAGEVVDWVAPAYVKTTQLHFPYELNSVQHYAVLIAAMHLENPGTLAKLSEQVAARSLLYIYARERTGMFETIIPGWAKAIKDLPKDAEPSDLDEIYKSKAFMPETPVEVLVPAMRANMASWSYDNSSDRKRIRSLLGALNLEISNHFSAPDLMRTRKNPGERTGWDIDHIMPQSLVSEKWVHKLGNLTLLAPDENTWANNTLPSEKISKNLYSQSFVFMTKICDDVNKMTPLDRASVSHALGKAGVSINYKIDKDWNEEAVAARTQFLIDWAVYVLVERYL
jgi:hypothetical protein